LEALINKSDIYGHTALAKAANEMHADVVIMLLEAKADVKTIQMREVVERSTEDLRIATLVTKYASLQGVDANRKDKFNLAPLHYWATAGNYKAIEMMHGDRAVWSGMQVDCTDHIGCTPLMLACEKDFEDVGRLLIKCKADVNKADRYGETVLMHAIKAKKKKACRILLELKADVNARDKSFGYTPLAHAASKGQIEIMKMMLEEFGATPTKTGFEAAQDANDKEAFLLLREHLENIKDVEDVRKKAEETKEIMRIESVANEKERLAELAAEWRGEYSAVQYNDHSANKLDPELQKELDQVSAKSVTSAISRAEALGADSVSKIISSAPSTMPSTPTSMIPVEDDDWAPPLLPEAHAIPGPPPALEPLTPPLTSAEPRAPPL